MGSDAPIADSERRSTRRVEVSWAVDCETEDTFLFAWITNISAMGIFVQTDKPLEAGTTMRLRFTPKEGEPAFEMTGCVQWINPVKPFGENLNPGMGILFIDLTPEERERLVATVRTIAYLRDDPPSN